MKILKISENQIRCILTSEDLKERNLKLSELAYGSQKARDLFSEMMTRANQELGFNAQDEPLMVEAIPISKDELDLLVTKVSDPEMLDTRFARFSKDPGDTASFDSNQLSSLNASELSTSVRDILEAYEKALSNRKSAEKNDLIRGSVSEKEKEAAQKDKQIDGEPAPLPSQRNFLFRTLEDLIEVSHIIRPVFQGESSVYQVREPEVFILSLTAPSQADTKDFDRICTMVSEFGSLLAPNAANLNTLREHNQVLIPDNAISKLSKL